MSSSNKKNRNKTVNLSELIVKLLIILIMILVIFIGVVIFISMFSSSGGNVSQEEPIKRNIVVYDDMTVTRHYDPKELDEISNHDVKMNSVWSFKDGHSVSVDAYVENPISNINSIYFDIVILGTDIVIYSSPVLPVGSHIENLALDTELKAGTYDSVLTYHLIGSDENTSVGELQMALKIIINN